MSAEADPPVAEDVEKTDEVAVEAVEAESTDKGDEPKSGTPDKALQKVQQEIGNITRTLAALTEKKESGRELTGADKAKLAKAQERIEAIKANAAGDPISEHLLDLTDKVQDQGKLKTELEETKARLAALENDRNWSVARTKYAGLDVDAIWTKALADAAETLGESGNSTAVNRLASRWFEERCDGAKKRLKEGDPKNKKGGETSPSTYKVGGSAKVAPTLSDDEEVLAMARQLVVDE